MQLKVSDGIMRKLGGGMRKYREAFNRRGWQTGALGDSDSFNIQFNSVQFYLYT